MLSNSPTSITQHFIRTHMEQRNLEEALSCLTDGVTWFGTGAFEVVRGKNQARQFLTEEIKAFPAGYTIAFSDMTQTMLTEDTGTVFGRVLVTDHMMGSQIDCRITATCVQWDGCFLIASLHMSLPTELQNDREYYPLTIAAKKVQQLKDSFFNETIPAGLFCCDIDKGFRLRYINDFFVRLLGYANKEEFLSETKGFFANCMSEGQDIAGIERDVQRMESNGHGTFTYRVKTKSGDEIWLREYTHKYENDGVFGLLCFCMDISDIIQLENQLKAQKSQLEFANAEIQTIVSNIPGGVHRCPLFGRIHVNYVSHGFEEMSGYTQSEIHEMFNDKYTLLLIEEDRSIFSDAIRQLSNEPADKHLEYRMRRKDGTVIRVVDHFRSVRMEDGKMWGFGVATDVTSQYETLEQLKLLTDSIPGGLAVYEYSLNGFKNLYFSDGVCEMIGYTRDEYRQMTKDNFLDMIFEEDLPLLRDKIHQVIVGSSAIDCVYRLRTKSDGYRWMNLRGTVADRRDDMIRVNAVLFDITDAKESEEKLRIRDEEYSLAIKQSGKRVYRYTLSDRSLYMLQKSIDLFELSSYEKNVPARIVELGFIAPESVNDCMAFYDAIFRGVKSGCTILRCKLKNGGFGWCSAHFTTIFNSNGDPVSAVVSIEDITKQHEQELENQVLRQNEELFQVVVSHSDRFIMKYDIKTQTAYVPPRTALAFSIEEVLHNVPYCCVEKEGIAEESIQIYVDFYEKLISGEATAEAIVKRTRNGHFDQWGWYRFDGSVIFDDTNKPVYAVVSFVEVTEQYERELAYERMSQHVDRLSKDAMLYFEANLTEMKIESSGGYWLSNIQQRLDAEPLVLLETAINDLIYSEDRDAIRFFFDKDNLLIDFAANKTEKEAECRILQGNQPKWVQITVEMIADPYTENILVYVLFRDIDKAKTKEMNMLKLAETDGLTNLYNRTAIEDLIRKALERRQDQVCALIIVDVDDLKKINDTLGHMEGDHAIIAFANTLRNCFGKQDMIGRIGGDEFLVFLTDAENEENMKPIMRGLIRKLSALRVGENDGYQIHGSVGVIISHSGEDSFETLYKKADTALYYVKRHGKSNYAFYTAGCMDETDF